MLRIVHRWILTWQFETSGRLPSPDEGYVLAVPHSSLLIVAGYLRGSRLATMVSQSEDGDLAAALLALMGYRVARGSTSNGSFVGLRGLARLTRTHPVAGLTVDGPRGPAWSVQPGVVSLARATGLPIVPVVAHGPGFAWPSWDRTQMPWPGASCTMHVGRSVVAPPGRTRGEVSSEVRAELLQLKRLAGI